VPASPPEPHENTPVEAELVPPDPTPPADFDERGIPSLDHVRDKIESRYATAIGATELAEESAAGRDVADQEEERKRAAAAKLEEIRRSLG
jgi:phage shock protein A